ncbi:MAG TPA: hypothetical protein VJ652_00660 [Noviherbaspirillum sp.]|nr:hypothetical protein [Noviherbaspirillum sp.]
MPTAAAKAAAPKTKTTAKAAEMQPEKTAVTEKRVPKAAPKAEKKPVKAATKAATKAAAKAEPAAKEKAKKIKLVRDSFTMPESEYAVLGEVKKACLKAGIAVKKSELLRVGVALLRQLDTGKLQEVLAGLPALKAGRPKKGK